MLVHGSTVVYQPRDNGLCTTAKRYWIPEILPNASDPQALTAILLHSTSFHKETWEPSLEHFLTLSAQPGSRLKIREAWALDCPNHGEAARINEPKLHLPEFRNNFTCEKYAQSVHDFLSSDVRDDTGTVVDFRKRKLLGIGHSLGGNAMLNIQHIPPIIRFTSLVIVEPMISPGGAQHLAGLRSFLVKGAYERRDVWLDRKRALAALQKGKRTKRWDPRVIQLFVDYAVMPHPGGAFSEAPYTGVTLACSRDQEAAMYRDLEGATLPVDDLNKACHNLPIHLILGTINDFIPVSVHALLLDPKSGRKYASFVKIEGVGHLIPQETPKQLGEAIYNALAAPDPDSGVKAKL